MALILGTKAIEHDACFALLQNGKPLFVYEQERFNRIKHGQTYALDSLMYGLRKYNIKVEEINYVAVYTDVDLRAKRTENILHFFGQEELTDAADLTNRTYEYGIQYTNRLLSLGFDKEKIYPIRHHLAHCSAVFYPSPYKESAILSIDGGGELETCVLAHGEDRNIDILRSNPFPHSLGHLYESATRWLGWSFGEEGKTMALASYGKPVYYNLLREKLIDIKVDGSFFYKIPFYGHKEDLIFQDIFGPKRKHDEPLTQKHKDVAATIQFITEEIMIKLAKTLKYLTGSDNLLITGGVGLNSVANGKIAKERIFKNIIVYPQANDAGTALGGALYLNYNIANQKREKYWVMESAYLGKEIDTESVNTLAKEYDIKPTFYENIEEVTAKYIAKNKIVAWVQGREEFGPRALGNRSIIANPLDSTMKDKINERVKFRESWRPFAPSVMEEDASLFFELDIPMPYMTIVSEIKKEWRDRLTSIGHIDHTARVQTVNQNQNKRFYNLLSEVKKEIGIGMLLNTSFNVKGEPLVQTARQAMEDFLRTDIDILVIDNYLFEKESAKKRRKLPVFHPIDTNIKKIADFQKILIYSFDKSTPSMHFKTVLEKLKITPIYINNLEQATVACVSEAAVFVRLPYNPVTLNHLKDGRFIRLLLKLEPYKERVFFEFNGEIIRFDDCSFLLQRFRKLYENAYKLGELLDKKPYLAVPKDTCIDQNFIDLEKISGFIFADIKTLQHFAKKNDSINGITKKLHLIDEKLDMKKPYIINDKDVYKEFVAPKLKALDINYILFYDQNLEKIDENTPLYSMLEDAVENYTCPVCQTNNFSIISKAYTKPDSDGFHYIDRYYTMCQQCGSIVLNPIKKYLNFTQYGLTYYNQIQSINEEGIEKEIYGHIVMHQIPLYETLREFLLTNFKPSQYKKWLDVGSAGVPTAFSEYEFTTIEPDYRTVEFGRLFFNTSRIKCNIIEQYRSDELYDGILFHRSFYCLATPNEAIESAKKLLRNGGVIVVAIGQFFMEMNSPFQDGLYLRIEDILRGETLNVYYNEYSLKYLFEKHGFVCIQDAILSHKYHKNQNMQSRYFVFQKMDQVKRNEELIDRSKEFMTKKLHSIYATWEEESRATLQKFDHDKAVFIGDFELFWQLQQIYKMENIAGFVDSDNKVTNNYQLENIECLSYEALFELENMEIIICSYDKQKEIIDTLKKIKKNNSIYRPLRSSLIRDLYFDFGKKYITKCFRVTKIEI